MGMKQITLQALAWRQLLSRWGTCFHVGSCECCQIESVDLLTLTLMTVVKNSLLTVPCRLLTNDERVQSSRVQSCLMLGSAVINIDWEVIVLLYCCLLNYMSLQVLTRCTDARACLFVSQFMLDHLMRHQQERYWSALRQLVATAQQQDDERLLGNPFLQLVTLLSQQTKQQGPSSLAASPQQGTAVAAGSGGRGGKLA